MRNRVATRVSAAALAAACLSLCSAAARADDPPAGTEALSITEGTSKEIAAPNGAQVMCDDPGVARGDIVKEKFVIVGVSVGRTLCSVRLAGAMRGAWLVTVKPPEKK